ncbi:hypothetical protein MPER_07460 [Moniliophthora perniciosa FA553]|nr:hypothetical protein MPER_07460 [Moniliophthora perniciosa FA553]
MGPRQTRKRLSGLSLATFSNVYKMIIVFQYQTAEIMIQDAMYAAFAFSFHNRWFDPSPSRLQGPNSDILGLRTKFTRLSGSDKRPISIHSLATWLLANMAYLTG